MDKTAAMRLLRNIILTSMHSIHRGAESGTTIGLVVAFVGIAIMLGIGVQVLGNASQSFDCLSLNGTGNTSASTGWRGACFDAKTATQNSYALLIVILIVVAAVAILFVVKML